MVEAPSSKRRRASKPSAAATTGKKILCINLGSLVIYSLASLPSPDVPKVMFTGLRSTAAERVKEIIAA